MLAFEPSTEEDRITNVSSEALEKSGWNKALVALIEPQLSTSVSLQPKQKAIVPEPARRK